MNSSFFESEHINYTMSVLPTRIHLDSTKFITEVTNVKHFLKLWIYHVIKQQKTSIHYSLIWL